jgi:transcriptional regulator with XRE-family HTH domain
VSTRLVGHRHAEGGLPDGRASGGRGIGAHIKQIRKAAGFSQTKLGQALGISFQQVQKYETGQSRIAAERLQQIADALGVDVLDLYGGADVANKSADGPADEKQAAASSAWTNGSREFGEAFDRIKDARARYLLAELARVFAEIESR